jgi:aerobic carbon-monoxide dehydrogenase small subunit
MTDRVTLEIAINGERERLSVAPDETLVAALRERLALTGTKRGCDQGVCGACTVLVDGEPMRGCLLLAADCADRRITTIEGLAENGALSALQKAFVETGAIQCGFCTPGMILTATALLSANPKPRADEIREAISGNLCRCTGYTKIVEAAVLAAGDGE